MTVTQDMAHVPSTHGNLAYSTALRWRPVQLPSLRRADLLAHLSGAFDLAESQSPGHATRVAYLALAAADRLGMDGAAKRRLLYVALLHDAGVAIRSLPNDVDMRGGHAAAGAWAASRFGLDEDIQLAIRSSHERWDGGGRPWGLSMSDIPIEALVVSAAHWACDASDNLDNLLLARAQLQREHDSGLTPMAGREVGDAMRDVLRDDATWMALSDAHLADQLGRLSGNDGRPSMKVVERVAKGMGEIVDAAAREPGRSNQIAQLAVELGRIAGMPEGELRSLRVAAHLLDIGLLGVPRHVAEKPAILSIDEMEIMRRHPAWAARIVEGIAGMDDIAPWVEFHHERPDGRGYPEMLEGDETPLAARILAVADSYWALRADRPYRPAFGGEAALETVESNAGEQYDAAVVEMLRSALEACEQSMASA